MTEPPYDPETAGPRTAVVALIRHLNSMDDRPDRQTIVDGCPHYEADAITRAINDLERAGEIWNGAEGFALTRQPRDA